MNTNSRLALLSARTIPPIGLGSPRRLHASVHRSAPNPRQTVSVPPFLALTATTPTPSRSCGNLGTRACAVSSAIWETRLANGAYAEANADLRALSALRRGKKSVVARLLALHGDLPQELIPGPRVRVLHTIADVALWSDADGARLLQAWLDDVPRSAFDKMLAGRTLARFRFSEERERVRARLEVRASTRSKT